MSGAEFASVSSEFDIFEHRPIQTSVRGTVGTVYKPIAVDQNNLEFLITSDSDTYIELHKNLYIRGKFVSGAGKDAQLTGTIAVTINLLHSLFSQCNITFNNVAVTESSEHYNYSSYLDTPDLGTDVATSHLTNTYWYLDSSDM